MKDDKKVSVIVPAYNEEEGLPKVIEEIPRDVVDEIIVVDNASTDRTYEVAKSLGITVIRHERNLGKVASIHTGIKNAKGDIVVLIDADFTYPAKEIPVFIEELRKGGDLVIGTRFLGEIEEMSSLNKFGNKVLSLLASYAGGMRITDSQSGFRAFRRDFFYKINPNSQGFEFETEMTIKAAKHGYKIVEIPIKYRKRLGKSKLNPVTDGLKIFWALLSLTYKETSVLAKTILIPGVILNVIGGIFGTISVFEYVTTGKPQHPFYPLITVLFIIMGVQLFSLGLIIDNMTKKLDRLYDLLRR